jgi:transposase-like protein
MSAAVIVRLGRKTKKKCSLSVSDRPLRPVEYGAVFSTSLWLRCCVHTYRESVFFGTKKNLREQQQQKSASYILFVSNKKGSSFVICHPLSNL